MEGRNDSLQPEALQQQLAHCGVRCDQIRRMPTNQADAIRLYRAESLLRRAAVVRPPLAQRLLLKVEALISTLETRPEPAAQHLQDKPVQPRSELAALLLQWEQRTSREAQPQEPASFEALLRRQEVEALQQVDDADAVASLDALAPAGELRALQQLREEWARRSTEKAVAKALQEAPEDAGPLNAHRLVVRALETMQASAPEYLGRFVNYIETLLWLEQASSRLLSGKDDKGKRRRQ